MKWGYFNYCDNTYISIILNNNVDSQLTLYNWSFVAKKQTWVKLKSNNKNFRVISILP